jgi:hypothetical protein
MVSGHPGTKHWHIGGKTKRLKSQPVACYQPVVMHRLYKIFLVSQNLF